MDESDKMLDVKKDRNADEGAARTVSFSLSPQQTSD